MHIHLFDQRLLDLMQEIHSHHPHIIKLCSFTASQDPDFYLQLCEVAAACGVVVEGDFTDKDVYKLCEFLTKHLVKSRTILIQPDAPTT